MQAVFHRAVRRHRRGLVKRDEACVDGDVVVGVNVVRYFICLGLEILPGRAAVAVKLRVRQVYILVLPDFLLVLIPSATAPASLNVVVEVTGVSQVVGMQVYRVRGNPAPARSRLQGPGLYPSG